MKCTRDILLKGTNEIGAMITDLGQDNLTDIKHGIGENTQSEGVFLYVLVLDYDDLQGKVDRGFAETPRRKYGRDFVTQIW